MNNSVSGQVHRSPQTPSVQPSGRCCQLARRRGRRRAREGVSAAGWVMLVRKSASTSGHGARGHAAGLVDDEVPASGEVARAEQPAHELPEVRSSSRSPRRRSEVRSAPRLAAMEVMRHREQQVGRGAARSAATPDSTAAPPGAPPPPASLPSPAPPTSASTFRAAPRDLRAQRDGDREPFSCGHRFHRACWRKVKSMAGPAAALCPLCRALPTLPRFAQHGVTRVGPRGVTPCVTKRA